MTAARLAAACVLIGWTAAAAQNGPRVVEGRVVRPGANGARPVAGAWVVLHRVASDTSGPLDSTRTRADGSFTIHYRAFGPPDAIYFLATKHDGIAYLSSALKRARVTGADAELTVFDTTSHGVVLHARGRHVVILTPHADGSHEVFEAYELANDASFTLVSGGASMPTWTAPLPAAAMSFHAEQGDVSAGAMVAAKGMVEVFAPFAPGLKQITFSYQLPASAFPLTLAPSADTLVLEVLLEEPGSVASGAGLRAMGPQTLQGRQFTRFLSPNAPPSAEVRITAGAPPRSRIRYAVFGLVIAIAGAMMIALFLGLKRN